MRITRGMLDKLAERINQKAGIEDTSFVATTVGAHYVSFENGGYALEKVVNWNGASEVIGNLRGTKKELF